MIDRYQNRARALVIMGLAVNVIAALIDLINVYGDGTYKFLNFSGMLGIFLSPLTGLSTIGAWWFLTKMTAESSAQRSLLEKAMYWFAVEVLLGVVVTVNYGWHQLSTTWSDSIVWIMSFGGAIEAIGIVALARTFGTATSVDSGNQEPSIE
jgi:hypothetical protein